MVSENRGGAFEVSGVLPGVRKLARRVRNLSLLCAGLIATTALPSFALNNGAEAPEFTLNSYTGQKVSLSDYRGKIVVLEWFNPGCPFVVKHYKPKAMQELQRELTGEGVVWLAVSSTAQSHRDFLTPEKFKEVSEEFSLETKVPYLADPLGETGKKYGATTTPHMFVIDEKGVLRYSGAIDDNNSPSADPRKAVNYVREAVKALKEGKEPETPRTEPYGCSVKY